MERASTSVRWTIVAMLTSFSFVSYVQRMNISIAAKFMMPEFALSEIQMGQIFSSFMFGYALFQIPAGMLGDQLGPRFVLTVAAVWWGFATLLTGLVPGLLIKTGVGIFISLLVIRFLLGVGEAATYPVAARAIANWIPSSKRAFSNAIVVAGLSLGSAATPPLISWLVVRSGWRESFYVTSGLAFLIAILWSSYATDYPEQHSSISQSELALICGEKRKSSVSKFDPAPWLNLLRNRDVLLVSLSYFFDGYVLFMFVFWFYTYLVDVRGFSILSGGVFASVPFVMSTILTPTGGALCDWFSTKFGRRWGRRITAIGGFSLSALFLFYGAKVQNPYLAIAALSLSVGFVQFTEGAFWATAIDLAGPHAGAASGIMNMLGNLGGVISTALVPVLVTHLGWFFALGTGAAFALVGGVIWLGVRADQPLDIRR